MLSIAKTALPSTIRDSFSRNSSDNEQPRDGVNGSLQKQSDKTDLLGNTRLNEINGNYSFPTPISTPKDERKQLNVDVESSTSFQENLAGTAEPTTNVDTTQFVTQPTISPSSSVTSLKLEHFDDFYDDLTTPIAGDIASQIPRTPSTSSTTFDRSDSFLSDTNSSRKFRLPAKSNSAKLSKQKKRRSRGHSGNILDESLIDSPSLSGYVPAAPRRNIEFHALFRSVPEEDYLINDYGCALQKEILVQGRLYVSANHVCFNANIFGWVTNLVIAFSDIVSIEKKMTAYVIPNAIQISTLHAKHFFTTFLSRDSVYDLLYSLWKHIHPSLTMTSFTESECGTSQKCSDASDTSEDNFTSNDDGDEGKSTTSQGEPRKKFALPKLTLDPMRLKRGFSNSTFFSDDGNTLHQEKVDNIYQSLPPSPKKCDFVSTREIKEKKTHRPRSKSDIGLQLLDADIADSKRTEKFHTLSPRNQNRHITSNNIKKHRPTQCACLKKGQHYDNISLDTKFTGSVEKIFNLLFTSELLNRFLTEDEKCTDLEIGEWNTEGYKWTRSESYTKPLNNSIGPKSTKCIIKDECQHRDFDNYVSCLSTTTTPDVPSGNNFCVKNRTCIMWAGANESRIIVTCSVEWSKYSFLKGPIEKACIDGQQTHWNELAQAVKKYIAAHPSEFGDESGAPVQEENVDSEVVDEIKRTHTRPKDRIRPANTEASDLQENEPVTVQRHNSIWNAVINILSSILNLLIKNITIPSTNIIVLLILSMLVINNFNNWLTLRNIGHKLDSLNGKRKGELFYKSYENQEYTPLFVERFENEGDDPLWQWLQERSKMYEGTGKKKSTLHTSDSESTPSKSEGSPSPQIHFDDNVKSRRLDSKKPISSQSLHDQIGDVYRLIQVAEGHVRKLVDFAEFESSYHKGSEDNMSRQQYGDEL